METSRSARILRAVRRHPACRATWIIMEQLLSTLIDKEIDIVCTGAASLRGKLVKVKDGMLQLRDDEGETCYVTIDKIVVVWEKRDRDRHPGFIFKS